MVYDSSAPRDPSELSDPRIDPIQLTIDLVDIPSPSYHEEQIADAVEASLRALDLPDVEILRFRNNVLARTHLGRGSRVILAGHLDTVPIADNVPHRRGANAQGEDTLFGCGTVDMKSGLAVYLHAFTRLVDDPDLSHDLTFIAYEAEEVVASDNGLGHVAEHHPEWLQGDLALLGEPTGAWVEAGCQGTIRLKVTAHGRRAHSARGWLGVNAMHVLSPYIARAAEYEARSVLIDDLTYREGLNIVHCESGVAKNTLPDEAWMFVNFRFAPNRSIEEAIDHAVEVLGLSGRLSGDCADEITPGSVTYTIDDAAGGALPGLSTPAAQSLVDTIGRDRVRAKFGWTDVARFSALGIPSLNFGSGDPSYAHTRDEQCPVDQITDVAQTLMDYLRS